MSDSSWYQRDFNTEYLHRYLPLLTPERTEHEVEGILDLLGLAPGAAILDLCCGHGRHSVELARRGFRVTGLDLSECFLEHARQAASSAGVEVRWVHSDMREIPFRSEFDAVVNMFTAFGYLEDEEEDQRVLAGVAGALRPGGRFLMETIHRDCLLRRLQDTGVQHLEDGTVVVEERRFDVLASRHEVRGTTLAPDGTRKEFGYSLRLYTVRELCLMMRSSGLEVEAVYGGLDRSPLTLESRRIALVARKLTG